MNFPTINAPSPRLDKVGRRIAKRLAAAILALVAVACGLATPAASGAASGVAIDVAPSGNLTIEVLTPFTGLRILDEGVIDGAFLVWVYDRDPANPEAQILEIHTVFDVTKNAIITPFHGSSIVVGGPSTAASFPGDLRIEARDATDHWTFALDNVEISADLRIYSSDRVDGTINETTVDDDTIIDGYGRTTLEIVESRFEDRVRIAARGTGTMSMVSTRGVAATDVLFIGGAGDDVFDALHSGFVELRGRLRGGADGFTLNGVSIRNELNVNFGSGDDYSALTRMNAKAARLKLGAGDDALQIDGLELDEPLTSVLSGGAGAGDTFQALLPAPPGTTVRGFETVLDELDA